MPIKTTSDATKLADNGRLSDDTIGAIFGDADGPFTLFQPDGLVENEQVFQWGDSPGKIAEKTGATCLDLRLPDGRLAAVSRLGVTDGATVTLNGPAGRRVGIFGLWEAADWPNMPEVYADEAPVFSTPAWTVAAVDATKLYTIEDLTRMAEEVGTAGAALAEALAPTEAMVETKSVEPVNNAKARQINAAELIGGDDPDFETLMGQEISFLSGMQFGQGHPRNTQAGKWKASTMTWLSLILGFDGTAMSPEFGLSRHYAGDKEGTCIVFGSSVGGQRKAKAMDTMYAMALDIDTGFPMDKAIAAIQRVGLAAILYTSHSHMKSGLEIKRDDIIKRLDIHGRAVTINDVRVYLRDFSKSRYEPEFISAISLVDERRQTEEGVKVVLDTPPIEKYRLILPLMNPVRLIDLHDLQDTAVRIWADKITGLAVRDLGIHFDVACTDPSRLFYLPRHPEGSSFRSVILTGKPIDFEKVSTYSKLLYAKDREITATNAFLEAAGDAGGAPQNQVPEVLTAETGTSLKSWHSKMRSRFKIVDVLQAFCADRIRNQGGEGEDKAHVECPFEHEHSKEGGTACMAWNPEASEHEMWTVKCQHDSCQGRHKLEHLGAMLADGWFPESAITDEMFLLPPSDEEIEEEKEAQAAADLLAKVASDEDMTAYVKGHFSRNSTDDQIETFLSALHQAGGGATTMARAVDALVKPQTALGRRALNKFVEKATRPATAAFLKAGDSMEIEATDHSEMVIGTMDALFHMNAVTPALYHYVDALAVVQADSDGSKRIEILSNYGALRKVINDLELFHSVRKDDGSSKAVEKPAPEAVVQHVWHEDRRKYALPLVGLRRAPFYGKAMTLVAVNGYDATNQTILAMPDDLQIDAHITDPLWTPSDMDVRQSLRLIVEELLGDFWIDGLARPELIAAAMEGRKAPSLAALIGLLVLAFMRGMVDGPTPLHMMDKPVAGTGASLLSELIGLIVTGRPLAASSLPVSKEEIDKLLTTLFRHGTEIVNFDNINHSMDSGEFASALTKKRHLARILGSSNLTEVDVRTIWVGSANTVNMSGELLRRVNPIKLDTHLAKPAERDNFRHPDIAAHVRENRSAFVGAILTIVRNWDCKGRPPFSGKPLGSFEVYSRVIGGVVEAAGLVGFLDREHIEAWKDEAADDKDGGMRRFMDRLARHPVGTVFRAQGKESPRNTDTGIVEVGPVVTLLDELNASCDPYLGEEPILIHGWSYKEAFDPDLGGMRYTYGNAAAVSKGFAKATRKPHAVMVDGEPQTFRLEERKETKGSTRYWMRVKAE